MRRRLLLPLLLGATLGCTDPPASVPYCADAPVRQPLASYPCRSAPEGYAFETRLRRTLESAGGPLLVRVGFDSEARVAQVCAVRSVGPGQWSARARLGEILLYRNQLASGPACFADTRLDLNEVGWTLAHLEEEVLQCEREAEALRFENPMVSDSAIELGFLQCIHSAQMRRNELWIWVPRRSRWRIFVPEETARPRREARLACGAPDLASGAEGVPSTGIARPGGDEKLVRCMLGQGWRAFP